MTRYVVQIIRSALGQTFGPAGEQCVERTFRSASEACTTHTLQAIVAPAGRTRWRGLIGLDGCEVRVRGTSAREPNRSQTDVFRAAAIRARFSTEMFRRPRSTLDT